MLREERRLLMTKQPQQVVVAQDVELAPASPEDDHFIKIHRKEHDGGE